MRVVISQPMYFPWVGFLAQLALADALIWLDDAQFSKGSFTNRVQVKLPGGVKWMSIPLEGKGSGQRIADLNAASPTWQDSHLSMLRSAFQDRPHCKDALACTGGVYGGSLCDTLISSAEHLALAVGLTVPQTVRSSGMGVKGNGGARVLDMVRAVGGKTYVTGHGARNYLDHEMFEAAGIAVEYMDYAPLPWPQPGVFTPYVTGLDLVASVRHEDRRAHLNPKTLPWRAFIGGT